MTDETWNKHRVAKHYGVTTRTIERWRAGGKLPDPCVETAGCVRWRPEDIRGHRVKDSADINRHQPTNAAGTSNP